MELDKGEVTGALDAHNWRVIHAATLSIRLGRCIDAVIGEYQSVTTSRRR
jgi:hypothetical protein